MQVDESRLKLMEMDGSGSMWMKVDKIYERVPTPLETVA